MVQFRESDGTNRTPGDELADGALDAGLRAAFAENSAFENWSTGVLKSLEETAGVHSRVLLRDDLDEQGPVVKPVAQIQSRDARYQIMGEIARGGVGVVMKSRDTDLGRDVAMKTLRSEHRGNSAIMARFVTIFEQVCQTMAYAHTKGVIHRDLKPSNIMVGAFGEVQIVDWGLAKVLAHDGLTDDRRNVDPPADESVIETIRSSDSSMHSEIGSVMGTPAYMPPEQARGDVDRLDERSDVFSLGAILCEILTGKPPFTGERREVLRQAACGDLNDAFENLDACESHQELADIARRCLSPVPADRPRDGGAVAAQVVAHIASLEERARESELAAARADARASHDRRARRLILALALAVIAVIIVTGGGVFAMSRQRQERIQQRVRIVNAAIDRAAQLLGRATAATVGQQEPWQRALLAGESLSDELAEGGIEESTVARAESLLHSLDKADQDRRIIERIEEVVAIGAAHEDLISWRWMEEQLRAAFLDYGIDLNNLTPEETAARIRDSDLAPQLTDGLELWVGTCAMLPALGDKAFKEDDFIKWKDAFALADPDPVAAAVRELVYETGDVERERVVDLIDTLDFETVRPRTLSWLAFAGFGKLDSSLGEDIFRRAMLIYPDDFMLLFDYAYFMAKSGDWEKAVGAYSRCLAIRPRSAGVWRCLGVAHRNVDHPAASLDALRRSIQIQPDHAFTHLDLGITLEALGDRDGAISAYEEALDLFPELTDAQDRLDKLRAGRSAD